MFSVNMLLARLVGPTSSYTMSPSLSEITDDNIVHVKVEHLFDEQMAQMEEKMQKIQQMHLKSFSMTRQGTVVQKAKFELPKPEGEGSNKKAEEEKDETEGEVKLSLQDHIDSAVHHALINQSSVLVNTLTEMIKSVVDGTIVEEKIKD